MDHPAFFFINNIIYCYWGGLIAVSPFHPIKSISASSEMIISDRWEVELVYKTLERCLKFKKLNPVLKWCMVKETLKWKANTFANNLVSF